MVTKATKKKGSRVKVGKLKLSKETIKDLTKTEARKVRGGFSVVQGKGGRGVCGN
jgi:hypothetical protein